MDDVITLISESIINYDDYGNEIITTTSRDVFCKTYGVSRSEFYAAAQAGLKPEITIRLSEAADYEGEKEAVFHDERYDIIRVYRGRDSFRGMDIGNIELTLQKKAGNFTGDDSQ